MNDSFTTPAGDVPRLSLRPNEAAQALGVSERFLWQLTQDGEIPHRRLGSGRRPVVLYPIDGLREWLRGVDQDEQAGSSPTAPASEAGI